MRFLFVAVFAAIVLFALLQQAESQTLGDQIRCLTCPGNDRDHYDCCDKTRMCCEGRVKFDGFFPTASTTSYG